MVGSIFFGGVKYRNDVANQDNICSKCIHMVNYSSGYGYCYKKHCSKSSVSGDCLEFIPNILDRKNVNLNKILDDYLAGLELDCSKGIGTLIEEAIKSNLEPGSTINFSGIQFRIFGVIPAEQYSTYPTIIYIAQNGATYLKEDKSLISNNQ